MSLRFVLAIGFIHLLNLGYSSKDTIGLELENVIIKENRISIPYSDVSRNIEILNTETIRELQANSLNELLQVVGGVDLRQRGVNGVQGDLSIRGGTFEQSLILINGVKMIDPQTGHHMMNLPLDINDIYRVEVLKGPAARTYGLNGFAGAINIVTKVPEEPGVSLHTAYGQNELFTGFARLSIPVGNYRQSLSYGVNTSAGYRDNTDYDIHQIFYQSELNAAGGQLQLFGGYTTRDFGANGFYGNEDFTDQYEEVNTSIVSAAWEGRSGSWLFRPRISWRRNTDNWQFLRQNPEFFQNFHTTHVINTEFNVSKTFKSGILGIGVEYTDIDITSNNLGEHRRNQLGAHLEHRIILADDRIDITPGIYVLSLSDFGLQIYPGIDIGYRMNNHFKCFFSAGRTSRIPTYTDLYYEDRGNIGNPGLQEETAFTVELGAKYQTPGFKMQASLFNRSANNQIDWFRVTPDDKWMPDNFNVARYSGIDFSATLFMGLEGEASFLDYLRVNYLFLDASFEDNEFAFSRNVLENLKHQLVINPGFHLARNWQFNALLKYNDRVSLNDYMTIDANLTFKTGRLQLYAKATNLFDTDYRETNLVPMPGRWALAGIRADF